ncbi:hypothetical protein Asphe3_10900 [Pseudarthrobacter phenanthrenivorans Sphe3]|uniref:Uncharacterized protein n=1 Tax=Pseudarthrobacter phenanthrenivorans (strain DSM 18606 / JCM 16027 / LMG 23796 / Sphe3) TaxID=930171 RepID=F0M450_PSEPM|nr:hypothetical protein Asphe3_10900 [Pseudarthrobacter phenanthrenivorans Sphe3]
MLVAGLNGAGRWPAVSEWDLGIAGLGLLAVMSLVFGLLAQLIVGRQVTRWLWLYSALGYFLAGILVSEVWFGWATEEELQPNIDGLSFDEVLLLVTLAGLIAALTARFMLRRKGRAGGSAGRPAG